MKARWMALGMVVGLALALTLGWGFASGGATRNADRGSAVAFARSDAWADMQAMHDSPEMQRLHAQMPEELRAQCEVMHAQMGRMTGAMMGGDMSSHHEAMTGGGMTGPGSVGPGGMMGSGPGGMMGS